MRAAHSQANAASLCKKMTVTWQVAHVISVSLPGTLLNAHHSALLELQTAVKA